MKNLIFILFLLPVVVFSQSQNKNYFKQTIYKAPSAGLSSYAPLDQTIDLSTNEAQNFFSDYGDGYIKFEIVNDILSVTFNSNFPLGYVNVGSQTPQINSSLAIPNMVLGYLDCGPSYPDLIKVSILGNSLYLEYNYTPGGLVSSFNETFTVSLNGDGNVYLPEQLKNEEITYFDGIGRPIQSIRYKQSPTQKNIIQHFQYSAFGRQTKVYMPFSANVANLNYFDNAESAQFDFYSENQAFNDDHAYKETIFEKSPLDRVIKEGAVGDLWQPNQDPAVLNDKVTRYEYKFNTSEDNIRKFVVAYTNPNDPLDPSLINDGAYAPNELIKVIKRDENWTPDLINVRSIQEFTDKLGRLVLIRTINRDNPIDTPDYVGFIHDTYYVYDSAGNLSYILTPTVLDEFSTPVTETQLADFCYEYKYDLKNRLVEKKLPGVAPEFIVYDKQDRPILIQDGNSRLASKWLFTKYDALGRVVYNGEISDNRSRAAMQNAADLHALMYETRSASPFINGTANIYYSNNAFPLPVILPVNNNFKIHSVNYYDNYNFTSTTEEGIPGVFSQTVYSEPVTALVKGLITGTLVRVLDTDRWILSMTGYDKKARPIFQYTKDPYLKYYSTTESKLDFIGNVLESNTSHNLEQTSGGATYWISTAVADFYEYDNSNRIIRHSKQADGGPLELITFNKYDEAGKLIQKKIGGISILSDTYNTSKPLQTVDYNYNIRGWLTKINDPNQLGRDLFASELRYNNPAPGGTPLYNGNISQVYWKSANTDSNLKNYLYHYDDFDQLTAANDNLNRYTTNVYYNKAGNIIQMDNIGAINLAGTSFGNMDSMSYSYSGNKLMRVDDYGYDAYGFKDDALGTPDTTDDYLYDNNGNITKDSNKGITLITYNHLNLPLRVTFTASKYIDYIYDASGRKLVKRVTNAGNVTTTEYHGKFVFQKVNSNPLAFQYVPTEEGYITKNTTSGEPNYVYQYKDHLGNIRVSYTGVPQTLHTNSFQSTTEGFETTAGASQLLSYGMLKVSATGPYSGVYKMLSTTAAVGDRLKISISATKGNTDKVRIMIVERNPVTQAWEQHFAGYLTEQQIYDFDYVVSYYSNISIVFDKDAGSSDVNTATNFYLDNLTVSKITTRIVEENNYYPFGGLHSGYNNTPNLAGANSEGQTLRFGGKELDKTFEFNTYDFGARMYDPAIGRWMNIDPLAEQMPNISPYNYAWNNPIFFKDPTGMWGEEFDAEFDFEFDFDSAAFSVDPTHRGTKGERYKDDDGEWEWDEDSETWLGINGEAAVKYVAMSLDMPEVEIIFNRTTGEQSYDYQANAFDFYSPELVDLSTKASAFGVGLGVQTAITQFAVTSSNNISRTAYDRLTARQQTLKNVRALGKTGARYLTGLKVLGNVGNAINVVSAVSQAVHNPTAGNITRVAVQAIAIGANFIPGVGWAISLGINAADAAVGDKFYNWIDSN